MKSNQDKIIKIIDQSETILQECLQVIISNTVFK